MSERLDRLEALAETILQGLQQQRETQDVDRTEFRAAIADLRETSSDILEALRQQREINAAIHEAQNVDRAEFRAHVETSWQAISLIAQNSDRQYELIRQQNALIQEMQSEVRGLQTENRRILERLEAHFTDGHGGEKLGAISMLSDPEQGEEWSDEVRAKSLEEAERLCQNLAGETLTEVLNVTQKTRTPAKDGTYKFICWFKTEKSP